MFSSDIDGILNDYPNCFLRFLKECHGISVNSLDDAKLSLAEEYRVLKNLYRNSPFKYNLPFQEDALGFYKSLNERNIPLIFSTSRKFKNYPNMYDQTYKWLQSSGIDFATLTSKEKGNFSKLNITHHVDDEAEHALRLCPELKLWKIYILERTPDAVADIGNNLAYVNSFTAIEKELFGDVN